MLHSLPQCRYRHPRPEGPASVRSHPPTASSPLLSRATRPPSRPKLDLKPGALVQATITGLQPHQLDVSLGGASSKLKARIHITEVADLDAARLATAGGAAAQEQPGGDARSVVGAKG